MIRKVEGKELSDTNGGNGISLLKKREDDMERNGTGTVFKFRKEGRKYIE